MDVNNLSSNWKKLQETLKKESASSASKKRKTSDRETHNVAIKKQKTAIIERKKSSIKKRRMSEGEENGGDRSAQESVVKTISRKSSTATISESTRTASKTAKVNEGRSPTAEIGKYVAMDCEMVGVGPNPDNDSALARVSIVNFNGEQVYDSYVRPKEMVTDWRTHVSGIAPKHMAEARSLEQVQKDVAEILDGRILVGHAVSNDLDALLLGHPKRDIRDTSKHPPYRKIAGGGSPRLKVLASEFLGLNIQDGAHSSVEDAKATMLLYRRDKEAFEREHLKKWPIRVVADKKENGEDQKKKKKKKKKPRKRIHHDGSVETLERYWNPVPDQKDESLQTAYFRGRRLRGRRVAIPEGYQGIVVKPTERVLPSKRRDTGHEAENIQIEQEEPIKVLEKQATFGDFMVWGHEEVPAADDAFVKGVEEWLKMAEALHTQPSDAKTSST
ncbi:3'-5' exonuclease [Aspergillus turcosus]|uniref:RNA exonuclease 4 n=1 Tax=Aspergillus turcosus TaxID=1245748 RepID=A0A421DAR2_9EURO|nr:3'-5' exonuclease [Aspergillus turcosus]